MSQNYRGSGGYMNNSPSGGNSPGGMARSEASHSLRPITMAQMIKATQAYSKGEWALEDSEIGQVTVVAHIYSLQRNATNSIYLLDDGSGKGEARHWVDATREDDSEKWADIEENMYVRVTGGLKSFGDKRYINVTNIRPVKDCHEIFFHILDAITVTLIIQKGSTGAQTEQGDSSAITSDISAYSTQPTVALNTFYSNLPKVQRQIVQFILSQPKQEEGIHVAAIARAVGGDPNDINDALDTLVTDGNLFTGQDDSHFNAIS